MFSNPLSGFDRCRGRVGRLHPSRIDVAMGAPVTTPRIGLSGNSGGVGAPPAPAPHDGEDLLRGPGRSRVSYARVRGRLGVSPDFIDAPGCQSVCRPVTVQWVQPAAYGNEPYARAPTSGCGALDYRGRCEGETPRWCESGALMAAECLGRGGVCAWQNDTEGYRCLRCDPALMRPLLPSAHYEGSRFLRCEGTCPVSEDCAAGGRVCTPGGCVAAPPPVDAETPPDVADLDVPDAPPPNARPDATRDADLPPDDVPTMDAVVDAVVTDSDPIRGGCGCRIHDDRVGSRGLPVARAAMVVVRRRRRVV